MHPGLVGTSALEGYRLNDPIPVNAHIDKRPVNERRTLHRGDQNGDRALVQYGRGNYRLADEGRADGPRH